MNCAEILKAIDQYPCDGVGDTYNDTKILLTPLLRAFFKRAVPMALKRFKDMENKSPFKTNYAGVRCTPAQNLQFCCNNPVCTASFKQGILCPKCKALSYCSLTCLEVHAISHKNVCREVKHDAPALEYFISRTIFLFKIFPDSIKILQEVKNVYYKSHPKADKDITIRIHLSNFKNKDFKSIKIYSELMTRLYTGSLKITLLPFYKIGGFKRPKQGMTDIYFCNGNELGFCIGFPSDPTDL